jgi:hypothetical protein
VYTRRDDLLLPELRSATTQDVSQIHVPLWNSVLRCIRWYRYLGRRRITKQPNRDSLRREKALQ